MPGAEKTASVLSARAYVNSRQLKQRAVERRAVCSFAILYFFPFDLSPFSFQISRMSPLPEPAALAQLQPFQIVRRGSGLSTLLGIPTLGANTSSASTTAAANGQNPTFVATSTTDASSSSILATPTSSSGATMGDLGVSIPSQSISSSPSSDSTLSTFTPSQSTSPSVTPTDYNNDADSLANQSQHGGLSGGAIAGIIILCLIVVIGAIVFVTRKRFLSKRQQNRITWARWSTARFPAFTFRRDVSEKTDSPHPADLAVVGGDDTESQMPVSPVFDTQRMVRPTSLATATPSPPPFAYNSQMSGVSTASIAPLPVSHSAASGTYAAVQYTFIPSLPDELSISVGEVVRIIHEYDDGWSLCSNVQGEQGVIPNECLKRKASPDAPSQTSQNYLGEGTGVWRMSKRASSLRPDSTRYPTS